MSIVFRLKYNLGLISTADQLDSRWDNLVRMRDELQHMESSEELSKFEGLKALVESSEFLKNKRETENLRFSGSKEENLLHELKSLEKSYSIRNYHKISSSDDLKRLEKILAGPELKRFQDLQKEVDSFEFKNRKISTSKKDFANSPDFVVLQEYDRLRKSSDIRFWQKFGQSERYKAYLKTIGSKELSQLQELKDTTASKDFTERMAYLKDKKRYEKSDDYKKILLFKELDKSSFMVGYRKLKLEKSLDFFRKWEILLDEKFSEKTLDTTKWQPENWWGHKMSGISFSQEGEKQAFGGLNNVQLRNNSLVLWAKKEKVAGKVWNPAVGLIPRQMEYSSAILNSAEFFRIKEGVVEAKVRFRKDASIISAFSLTGEKPFPQIDLFRSSKSGVGMGILDKPGLTSSRYLNLSGLKDELFHIYRLEMFNNQLVWKINGYEVYRSSLQVSEPFFFNLLTTLHGEVNEQLLPHQLEVDWIRCFAVKS